MGRAFCGPSVEKIRNCFAFPLLENGAEKFLVTFGVNELDSDIKVPWVKVAETDFQRDKEDTLPILKTLAVLAYHGAPFMRHLRQVPGTVFQLNQVAQHVLDEFASRVGGIDSRNDRFG